MTEFNLSDKIKGFPGVTQEWIRESDVKEFIKRLKEQVNRSTYGYERVGHNFKELINELAGDKLI